MELEQWLVDQETAIDKKIDEHINEVLRIEPSSGRPIRVRQEKKRLKEKIKRDLTLQNLSDDIDMAFELIFNRMPNELSHEVWEVIAEEFSHCQDSVKRFWAECQEGKHPEPERYFKILGLTETTLMEIYRFGLRLMESEEPMNAQKIFGFLVIIAPNVAPFWLGLGRSYQFSGNLLDATEVYQYGKGYDPELGKFYLFLAECYDAMDDEKSINAELEQLSAIADLNSENKELWEEAKKKFH